VDREAIEGTPFHTVEYEGKFYIVWGEYVLTQPMETREEAIKLLEKDKWNVIGVYVVSIVNMTNRLIGSANDLAKIVEMHKKE